MAEMTRFRIYYLDENAIRDLLGWRDGLPEYIQLLDPLNIPKTARFIHAFCDPRMRSIGLVFDDESFEPTATGSMIPIVNELLSFGVRVVRVVKDQAVDLNGLDEQQLRTLKTAVDERLYPC
jgi:hypothetical protein